MKAPSTILALLCPLAPGRYRVTASGPDGRQISKPINLKNRPERKVTLRFKD